MIFFLNSIQMTRILCGRFSNILYKSMIFFIVGFKCIRNICGRKNRVWDQWSWRKSLTIETYCILSGGICRKRADTEIRLSWIPCWLGTPAFCAHCPSGPDNLANSVSAQSRSRSEVQCKFQFSIEFVHIYVYLTLLVGQKMNPGFFRTVRNHIGNVVVFNF